MNSEEKDSTKEKSSLKIVYGDKDIKNILDNLIIRHFSRIAKSYN